MGATPSSAGAASVGQCPAAAEPALAIGSSTASVSDAIASIRDLSAFSAALATSGIGAQLDSGGPWTVLAPDDSAFASLPAASRLQLMADPKGLLATVLSFDVISGSLDTDDLVGQHRTLEGQTITVSRDNGQLQVQGIGVAVCGSVHLGQVTVYVTNGVVVPQTH